MADKIFGRKGNAALDQLHAVKGSLDAKDPIYDSESEGDIYFESYLPTEGGDPHRQGIQHEEATYTRRRAMSRMPCPTKESVSYPDFLKTITEEILPGAIATECSSDVCDSLKALNCPQYHDSFVAKAVRLALDHPEEKQKWISELLTILFDSHLISTSAFNRGFEKLVQQAPDITLDVPDAHQRIFTFLRWAQADGALSSSFSLRLPELFLRVLVTNGGMKDEEIEQLKKHVHALHVFKLEIEKFILEDFMLTGSADDLEQVMAKGLPEFKHEVVRRLVRISMGFTNVERELVSKALSDLFGKGETKFGPDDILLGFMRLLGEIEDLQIDVPFAPTLLSKFLVRAVADEILPPGFILDSMRLNIGGELGQSICKTVKRWVIEERKGLIKYSRFQKIWEPADDETPEAKELKHKMRDLLSQHYDDEDIEMTRKQVDDMDLSPDQSVLFIRKVLQIALERSERERKAAISLLQTFLEKKDFDADTIQDGFDELRRQMESLSIDVPHAASLLPQLIEDAKLANVLSQDYSPPSESE